MNVDINTAISFIDIFIGLVLIWAIYKGYKRGAIVHSISLLVIVLGIALFGSASSQISDYIQDRTTISIDNAHYYIFVILFLGTIWLSDFIANKVEQNTTSNPKAVLNIILGILISSVKYLFLLSVFLLFISQIDNSYNFISSKEKNASNLYEIVKNIAPETIRTVDFLKK